MAKDLTKGSITKNLLITAIPTMIGFGAQSLYDLVDMFWIGKISVDALAGVAIFSTLFWIVEFFNEIIGTSSVSLISQNFGRKDYERTALAVEQTLSFKFLVALIAGLITAIFIEPAMHLYTKDPNVIKYGMEYGYLRLFFLPIFYSSYTVNTTLRCLGHAKTPMYIMIFTNILNFIFVPIAMFKVVPYVNIPGLGLGVFGVALVTVLSQTLAFIIGLYLIFSGREGVNPKVSGLFKLDWTIDKKLLLIGLPNGIEMLLRSLFQALLMYFVHQYGDLAVSAVGVGNRIFGFAFMPLVGFAMSGGAIVGQALGNNDVKRAEKTSIIAGNIGAGMTAIFFLITLLFGQQLIGIINPNPELMRLGSQYLVFGSLSLILIAYAFGFSVSFSGSGHNWPFFISSMISRWFVQLPILFICASVLHAPIIWVWLSYVFGDTAEFLISLYFFKKGTWKEVRVH